MVCFFGFREWDHHRVQAWVRTTAGCYPLPSIGAGNLLHGEAFNWGYGGAGPRMLARAILYAVCKDAEVAVQLEQHFKWEIVAKLDKWYWEVDQGVVEAWLIKRVAEADVGGVIELGDCGGPQS